MIRYLLTSVKRSFKMPQSASSSSPRRGKSVEILSSQGRLLDFEHTVQSREGREVWLSTSAHAVKDDHGAVDHSGPLDAQEWEVIRRHPEVGCSIAQISDDFAHLCDLILKHHERWDGQGYPLGLKGREIPLECRIMALADAFEVMTSDRPYRQATSIQAALDEIRRCSGTQFDPELTSLFLTIMSGDHS